MNDELKALLERGDTDAALALATKRLAEARSGGDDASLALALIDDARAQMAHGDRDEAVMTVDEAISRARKGLGPKDARYAEALELGGEIAAAASMPNAADARFRAAIEVLESAGIAGAPLAHALLHHGLFRRSQGDAVGAVRAFSAVVTRAGEDPEARAFGATALTEMGFVVLDEGQVASAREVGDRALEVFPSPELVGSAVLLEGEAKKGAEVRKLRARVPAAELVTNGVAAIEGCPFTTADVQGNGTVTLTVAVQAWLGAIGLETLPQEATPVDMSGVPLAELTRSVKGADRYRFVFASA